ncbi:MULTISPECIES: TerC family protein [unclassified Bacillus (in: firmicutes)]|uniref:TerC family protein n=1 Tax=unclassified Bacillus (in: firmicutes) TaxID=185979 RepID=UPI0008EE832D|nr:MULTISPECIES: TerC family protein [unclassified Bacillus (in: firmicutes)]SFJ08621.1 integral membrane protein, YjbE family [Bacillus sp. 71mf]SFS67426.1 integral membrane protein, YjbE family [Bacillus sp. 103mf]
MDLDFLTSIFIIVGIDVVLGGDNAIVIALASRNLPEAERNKAIVLGTGLAIILRILLTIMAVYLLNIPFLQLAGGILLTFIAINLLTDNSHDLSSIKAKTTLFQAVRTIVFADLVMGFDNVLAIAGASHGNITLVVLGLLISIPIIIWGSKLILLCMERFPLLVYIGATILAYTAGSMVTHEKNLRSFFETKPLFTASIPFLFMITVLLVGIVVNQVKLRNT